MKVRWLLVVAALGGVALAATLSDFKDAVGREGCESIPYDDLRGTCKSKSSERDDYCKSRGPFACDDLDPAGLTKQIENVKQKIEELKHKRDDLKSKRNDAKDDSEQRDIDGKIGETEKQIDDLQRKVDDWARTLSDEKHAIEDRIYVGGKCLEARKEVAETFSTARRRARSETDPETKQLADKLIEKWETGEPGHSEAIEKVQAAITKCKNMK